MHELKWTGRITAALLCAVLLLLPALASAAPVVEEGTHGANWWVSLDSRLLQLVANWWPGHDHADAESRRLGPTPSPDGEEGRRGVVRFKTHVTETTTCTGEGGPEWDPDGCS